MAPLVMPRRSPFVIILLALTLAATAALAAPLAPSAGAATPTGPTASAFDGASPTGPDVSNWQHPSGVGIDWRAVRDSGQQFAIVKATQGTDSVNPWFRTDFD